MAMVVPLPQDMVEDILSRLPVKSLQRLRCMSKSTDSLICARSFAMMHMKQGRLRQKILLSSDAHLMSFEYAKENAFADEGSISRLDHFPLKTHGSHISFRIVGSCHGLLCISLKEGKDFYLWNPSTRHYNKLPDPPVASGYKPFAYGFGYDSFSDDYKLVYGVPSWWRGEFEPKVYILSLRENCWRNIKLVPPFIRTILRPRTIRGSFLNGTLNWMAERERSRTFSLFAFDLKTERFFELPMPDKFTKYFDSTGFEVLEGRLCLLGSTYDSHYELWMMNEYGVGQSWIRLPDVLFEDRYCDIHFPLGISKDNQIILLSGPSGLRGLTRLDAQERKLVEYGLSCECEDHYYKYRCRCRFPREGVVYLESLVSPNVNNKYTCVGKRKRKDIVGVDHNQNQIWHGRLRQRKKKLQ